MKTFLNRAQRISRPLLQTDQVPGVFHGHLAPVPGRQVHRGIGQDQKQTQAELPPPSMKPHRAHCNRWGAGSSDPSIIPGTLKYFDAIHPLEVETPLTAGTGDQPPHVGLNPVSAQSAAVGTFSSDLHSRPRPTFGLGNKSVNSPPSLSIAEPKSPDGHIFILTPNHVVESPPVKVKLHGGRRQVPKRDDIHRIMVIGSGPIVIGQAAE